MTFDSTAIPVTKKFIGHENEIVSHFGADKLIGGIKKGEFSKFQPFFLSFTNRCGSNALAEDVKAVLNIGLASERLNSPVVLRKSIEKGFEYFDEYLFWLFSSQKTSYPGVKVSIDQLLFLYTSGVLNHCFNEPLFVYMKRRDLLAQAVSTFIARETKQWTSHQEKERDEPAFDEKAILKIMANMAESNSRFEQFFSVCGIRPINVTYEDYSGNPNCYLSIIADELGASFYPEQIDRNRKIVRQESSVKQNYYDRIVSRYQIQERKVSGNS